MRNFLSPLILQRTPSLLRTEYRQFYDLIKSYFEFLEETGNPLEVLENFDYNLEANHEVDVYIDKLLTELGFDINIPLTIPKSELLLHLREFYLSRGSENSFKFLFKLLYNIEPEIEYPRDKLFVTSMATYSTRHFIFTTSRNINSPAYLSLINSNAFNITVTGVSSKVVSTVENIQVQAGDDIYFKIQIDSDLKQYLSYEGVEIKDTETGIGFVEDIVSVIDVDISDPGHGYKPGDLVEISGCGISGRAEVKTCKEGKIQNLTITNPGSGYEKGDPIFAQKTSFGHSFSAIVYDVDNNGSITQLYVFSQGYDYSEIPILYIKSANGQGGVITASSNSIGQIDTIEFIDPYADASSINNISINVDSINGTGATITPVFKTIFSERGSFKSRNGMIGSDCVLHDSYYYQQFSYSLKTNISRNYYDAYVDELLHPPGFVRFSILEIIYNEKISNEQDIFTSKFYLTKTVLIEGYDKVFMVNPIRNLEWYKTLDNFNNAHRGLEWYTEDQIHDDHYYMSETLDPVPLTLIMRSQDPSLLVNPINNLEYYKESIDNYLEVSGIWDDRNLDFIHDNSHLMTKALETEITIV